MPESCQPSHLEKITDLHLRDFVLHPSSKTETVLVEVDLPEPEVDLKPRDSRRSSLRAVSVQSIDADTTHTFREVDSALRKLLASPPVPLPAAHAFAAVVTAEQLLEICHLQGVRSIGRSRSNTS